MSTSIDRGHAYRKRARRLVLVMCAVASCRDGARVAADTARQAPPPVAAHDAYEPERAGAPTDSFLPTWTYDSVPGWLVIKDLWADPVAATFRRNTARLKPDSVVAIFPFDSSWARANRRRSLTLLLPEGAATVFPNRFVGKYDHDDDATVVALRSPRRFSLSGLFAAWLLPTEYAKDAVALPIHDEVSADSNRRTWAIGPVRLVLRRSSPVLATLTAERDGVHPQEVRKIGVDTAEDNQWGVESPKTLSLVEKQRIPMIGSAFRVGNNGPIVVVYEQSGYECLNVYAVVFFQNRIRVLDEPSFYECTR